MTTYRTARELAAVLRCHPTAVRRYARRVGHRWALHPLNEIAYIAWHLRRYGPAWRPLTREGL